MIWIAAAWATSPAAWVLLVEGQVTEPGRDLPLARGDSLEQSTTVRTGEDAAVILELHNGYLVRLESELEFPLERVALMRAPVTTLGIDEQLEDLIDPEERKGFGGLLAARESVNGFRAQLAVDGGAAGTSDLRASKKRPTRGVAATPPVKIDAAEVADKLGDVKLGRPSLVDRLAVFQPDGEAYRSCVVPWVRRFGVDDLTETVVITAVLDGKKIKSLHTPDAIPLPRCLRSSLIGKGVSGNTTVELHLD